MEEELLELTKKLLDAIGTRNWDIYADLCDPSLTCFEPEALGALVEGMEFHRFYFDASYTPHPVQNTICSPHVRAIGSDAAVISYIRLVQRIDNERKASTTQFEETRIWQKIGGYWKHSHFHRSCNLG